MNTKTIAKLLLGLADSFDTNDPDTTNYRADTLRQIANEIEPQPEPEFKVGDWVEYKGNQYRISAFGGEGMMFLENAIFALTPPYPVRKLDPSEVIVKIGCLKGTVAHSSSSHFCLCAEDNWTMIAFDMLDTPTRELVESLLKAQEEK